MRRILVLAFLATGFLMPRAAAQYTLKESGLPLNAERTKADKILSLQEEKERIKNYEKDRLKKEIERLDALVTKDSLSPAEAQTRKEEAARAAALNIDNKTAIVDNQIALVERDESYEPKANRGSSLEIGLGNAYDEQGSMLLGIQYRANPHRVKYDRRTYSDVVLVGGLGNVISSGRSPYATWKSLYSELGFTWRTRLRKNDNFFRLAYGLSFQVTALSPTGDRYFVDDYNGHTTLQPFGYRLKRNQMYFTNLVFPVFLEFGKSEKVTYPDRVRYYINNNFKAGIGGYGGFNIRTAQRLKWTEDGNRRETRDIQDYNTNNLVYGVAAYVGFGALSLYAKYDLNPLFKNAEERERLMAIGFRMDF